MPAVEIKDLCKTFLDGKQIALNQFSAEIPENKITGIVGPDGAGKTTLLRILSGLMTIDSGDCTVFSEKITKMNEQAQANISYLPQKLGLYDDLTVSQNISLYCDLQNIFQDDPYFTELMNFTGLAPFGSRMVGNLSGGMKQKLGLMTAMLRKPRLLLLDEPTVGVDPVSQNDLWQMINQLQKQNVTIVISTSYLDEAEKCQHVLLLNEGNLIFSGEPETFKKTVKDKTYSFENVGDIKRKVLDQLLGKHNIIDTIVEGEKVNVTFNIANPNPDPLSYGLNENALLKKRKPIFEDAFISNLGGIPRRPALTLKEIDESQSEVDKLVEAKGLSKMFGPFLAVNNVSFSIGRGEIFGLLGPNGAGKSTTFKMLCGLLSPTEGDALVDGISLNAASSLARSKIGYMAQKFSLYNNMTVLQNMNFFAGIYSFENSEEKINEMVIVFDLQEYLNVLAEDLPLGYKQRLALSCSLMHQPKVLFLDEPTSGVDPLTRREFWHQLNGLASSGVSILISTHLMDEAEYCDRIGMIYKGELRVVDTPKGLKSKVPNSISSFPTIRDAFTYFCSTD